MHLHVRYVQTGTVVVVFNTFFLNQLSLSNYDSSTDARVLEGSKSCGRLARRNNPTPLSRQTNFSVPSYDQQSETVDKKNKDCFNVSVTAVTARHRAQFEPLLFRA